MSDHLLGLFEQHGGELRRHVKVSGIVTAGGRVEGVALADGEVVTAPVVVSNLDPTATFTQLLDRGRAAGRLRPADRGHRPPGRLLPDPLRPRAACPSTPAPTRCSTTGDLRHNVTFFGTAEQMQLDFEGCVRGLVPESPSFNLSDSHAPRPGAGPAGQARRPAASPSTPPSAPPMPSRPDLRDEMAERIVAKITSMAPNFPDLIERQFNYPAYTYELMFGCTGGDFTHGLLQPEFMGPFRPGPRGWPDNPVPIEGLYLCGAGCHGGPGVTFIPGYNCGYDVLGFGRNSRL